MCKRDRHHERDRQTDEDRDRETEIFLAFCVLVCLFQSCSCQEFTCILFYNLYSSRIHFDLFCGWYKKMQSPISFHAHSPVFKKVSVSLLSCLSIFINWFTGCASVKRAHEKPGRPNS